jgi:hypothetical protein
MFLFLTLVLQIGHDLRDSLTDYWSKMEQYVGFEILTALVMKSTISWDIIPCSPLEVNWHIRGTYCLHLQGRISPEDKGDMFLLNIGWISMDSLLAIAYTHWEVQHLPPYGRLAVAQLPMQGRLLSLAQLAHCGWSFAGIPSLFPGSYHDGVVVRVTSQWGQEPLNMEAEP